ncbi:MAG: tetratricopeptide repeat protein [Gemmatimonadetes bacterium]|nr:tetratricopeptide repeat protein [Gemmatimonadota bacterium]
MRHRPIVSALALAVLTAVPLRAQTPQYTSFAGVKHVSQPDTGAVARAAEAVKADPKNVDKLFALGMAQTSIRQLREAIATFTKAMAIDPKQARLYRQRGHRYISVGEFGKAMADLTKGAALDSMDYGIWYHLGVANFEAGKFDAAAKAFARGRTMPPSTNEYTGSTDWLWMSLARAGRMDEAKRMVMTLPDTFKIPVNYAYGRRLMLYRGELTPEAVVAGGDTSDVQQATLNFGVGTWYMAQHDTAHARPYFERAVATKGWPAFAYLLSERTLKAIDAKGKRPRG